MVAIALRKGRPVRARPITRPTQTHHTKMVALVLLVALHSLQVPLADGLGARLW